MNDLLHTVYVPAKMLVTIVERGKGETAMSVAKAAGARGGTIILGRGTADSALLRLLGLDDLKKDILLTLTAPQAADPIMEALRDAAVLRKVRGIVFRLDVRGMLRHLSPSEKILTGQAGPHPEAESRPMSENATHDLITVIVNAGYADDIMAAARKAGAPGGTVINARGTGKEEDVKFFGITIVPEKELILILTPREKTSTVLEAVKALPWLAQPGIGIAFCMDVERFMPLGGKG